MPFVASRWGLAVQLNGTDEYLTRTDGGILPAGAMDLDFTVTVGGATFGLLVRRNTFALDVRQVLMAKRNDADAAADAGFLLELTADNTVRLLLDDGTNQVSVETDETFPDDDFFHPIIVRIDYAADTAEIWCSLSKDPNDIKLLKSGSTSTLGDLDNAHPIALGAVYNGTTAASFAAVAIDWAGWWNAALVDEYIRGPVVRFQLCDPFDRRVVSFWHFTQKDGKDWNRVNANDLTATGIVDANYVLGQERFLERTNFTMNPQLADKGSALNIGTKFFRPAILQEGHFRLLGTEPHPELRLIRSTDGATTAPVFSAGTFGFPSLLGRYFACSDAAGSPTWFLYELPTTLADRSPSAPWEPIGTIAADADYANLKAMDGDKSGTPEYLFSITSGRKLVVTDIRTPASPSKAGTDATWVASGTPEMVLYDARDNDHVWSSGPDGHVASWDVSTRSSPSLAGTTSSVQLSGGTMFVQVGTRLYFACTAGIGVVDISTPGSPSFVTKVRVDSFFPSTFTESPSGIVILGTGHILTMADNAHDDSTVFALHVWDVTTDPDSPALLHRHTVDHPGTDGSYSRLNRYGNLVMVYNSLGSDHHIIAFSVADEAKIDSIAAWDVSDIIPGGSGVQTDGVFARGLFVAAGNSIGDVGGFYLFEADVGQGFSALQVDFDVTGGTVPNPVVKYEIGKVYHDLSAFDFEDDSAGTDPPTGWAKTGTGDAEVTADEGLTGDIPGGTPQSVRMKHTGGSNVVLRRTVTPATADMFAGAPHVMHVWYLIRGNGSISEGDLEFQLTERNSVSGIVKTYSEFPRVEKDRWHHAEIVIWQIGDDSDELRVDVVLQNLSAQDIDIYVDAWRLGAGRLPFLFAGRVMKPVGRDAHEGLFHAKGYEVMMVDWSWDFSRLDVTGEKTAAAASADVTIAALVSANTRSQDPFTTDNVHPELGGHDELKHSQGEKLGTLLNRTVEQAGGYWYVDFYRDVHALPIGYEAAPIAINDVVATGFRQFSDAEDGADIVTEGTVQGDQSKSERPSAVFSSQAAADRYGTREATLDADADIKTAAQATDVATYYQSLLGDRQREVGVIVHDEPRLRPGMVMPVQVENRGWDAVATIEGVTFSPGEDAAFLDAAIKLGQAKEDFLDVVLRAREDAANQKGKTQFPEQVRDAEFWSP